MPFNAEAGNMKDGCIPEPGALWEQSSLVWDRAGGTGKSAEALSPVDGSRTQRVQMLCPEEVQFLTAPTAVHPPLRTGELRDFSDRLHTALVSMRSTLLEAMQWETGFPREDCEEMVAGSLACVDGFCEQADLPNAPELTVCTYMLGAQKRQIQITRTAWGTVIVILPHNAFLYLALNCMLNALSAGNWVILRAPLQSARSAALLAALVKSAAAPQHRVSIVLAGAKDLLETAYKLPLPCLIHYLGSSYHAPQILADAFQYGKAVCIDGDGNTWVWVGPDACPEAAAEMLTAGAVRYNGQTCIFY